MCIIIAIEDTKKGIPTLSELEKCERLNPDGGSIAWSNKGKTKVKKDLTAKQIFDTLKGVKGKATGAIIHFRTSTVKGDKVRLQHPFEISSTAKMEKNFLTKKPVMFHNGVWTQWQAIYDYLILTDPELPEGVFSDSRLLAYISFKNDDLSIPDSYGCKTATLYPDGEIYYTEKKGFHKDKERNIWFSNYGYELWKMGFSGKNETLSKKSTGTEKILINEELWSQYCVDCDKDNWNCEVAYCDTCSIYTASERGEASVILSVCEECLIFNGSCPVLNEADRQACREGRDIICSPESEYCGLEEYDEDTGLYLPSAKRYHGSYTLID